MDISAYLDSHFFANYWQKKPTLFKKLLKGPEWQVAAEELAGLAIEEDVASRIIVGDDDTGYSVEHGPFKSERFLEASTSTWTLLVQEVNLHLEPVARLLEGFRIIPDWRLDDIMVSYATIGGSVGPHLDQYDVFLVQGKGRRRWFFGDSPLQNPTLQSNQEIALLDNPIFNNEFIAEEGDVLYIPPGVAHHGVAIEPCVTYSVGFRAPSFAEVLDRSAMIARNDVASEELRFKDSLKHPGRPEFAHRIGKQELEDYRSFLIQHLSNLSDLQVASVLGSLASEPKRDEALAPLEDCDSFLEKDVLADVEKLPESTYLGPFLISEWSEFLAKWKRAGRIYLAANAKQLLFANKEGCLLFCNGQPISLPQDYQELAELLTHSRQASFERFSVNGFWCLYLTHLYDQGLADFELS